MYVRLVFFAVLAYLIGAIPFGLLISKIRGMDIRKEGSGNIGATNVFRCVGKPWGILTFFFDVLKGFVPAFFFSQLADISGDYAVLFGALAILGHSFPVYLKFKGGKGVATSAGMLLGVAPAAVGIGFLCWISCFLISRYVSLASVLAAFAVAVSGWVLREGWVVSATLSCLGILVIWLHRDNIKRLIAGTEHRFSKNKDKEVEA